MAVPVYPDGRVSSRSTAAGKIERAKILYFRPSQGTRELSGNAFSASGQWEEGDVTVQMAPNPFSSGGIRAAHHCRVTTGASDGNDPEGKRHHDCVVKIPKDPRNTPATQAFADVEMQVVAQIMARRFSEAMRSTARVHHAQKPEGDHGEDQHEKSHRDCHFLDAFVLRFLDRPGQPAFSAEVLIRGGTYVKFNDNNGYVNASLLGNEAPQCFSHWTYEESGRQIIVVDIQGVQDDANGNDYWTDPQIHSLDTRRYGTGNLGQHGFNRFLQTHTCNQMCHELGLPRLRAGAQTQGAMPAFGGAGMPVQVLGGGGVQVIGGNQMMGGNPYLGLPPDALAAMAAAGVPVQQAVVQPVAAGQHGYHPQQGHLLQAPAGRPRAHSGGNVPRVMPAPIAPPPGTPSVTPRVNPKTLPSGWTLSFDAKHGKVFFVDHNTRSTTYTPPVGAVELPYEWDIHVTDTQPPKVFFLNRETRETAWDAPDPIKPPGGMVHQAQAPAHVVVAQPQNSPMPSGHEIPLFYGGDLQRPPASGASPSPAPAARTDQPLIQFD